MSRKFFCIFISSILVLVFSMAPLEAARSDTGVQIEVSYTALFEKNLLKGLKADWLFDPQLSQTMIADFDTNRNGIFDKPELIRLNEASLPTLHQNNFFTHLFVGEKPVPLSAISGIKANIEQGQVHYTFTLGITGGNLDAHNVGIIIDVYDPTTLTRVVPAESGVARLGEDAPPVCSIRAEQKDNAIIELRNGRRRTVFGPVNAVATVTTFFLTCIKT